MFLLLGAAILFWEMLQVHKATNHTKRKVVILKTMPPWRTHTLEVFNKGKGVFYFDPEIGEASIELFLPGRKGRTLEWYNKLRFPVVPLVRKEPLAGQQ